MCVKKLFLLQKQNPIVHGDNWLKGVQSISMEIKVNFVLVCLAIGPASIHFDQVCKDICKIELLLLVILFFKLFAWMSPC